MLSKFAAIATALSLAIGASATYGTYSVDDLPYTWQDGQFGYNQCESHKPYGKLSHCQNVFMNSIHDFCLWAPNQGHHTVGAYERKMVSYCMKSGYGTRLIPDGTIKQAHFIKTPHFMQVTGYGDFTKMHIHSGDEGGELDPHGADGNGNPIGGLVYTRSAPGAVGDWTQIHEWNNFMSATQFCFRACFPGDKATEYCPHIYDVMGCAWNNPGDYGSGFSQCEADSGKYPGVYGSSTFYQGQANTPAAHAAGSSSHCKKHSTIGTGKAVSTPYRRSVPKAFGQEASFEDAE